MNRYSAKSRRVLDSCHSDLIMIFEIVLPMMDHSNIEGERTVERQRELFQAGKSKIDGVTRKSKHNHRPSLAIDAVPYPIDWKDRERLTLFAGHVLAVAHMLYRQGLISHKVRWGGDWDKDTEVKDNNFDDLVHFELYKP